MVQKKGALPRHEVNTDETECDAPAYAAGALKKWAIEDMCVTKPILPFFGPGQWMRARGEMSS